MPEIRGNQKIKPTPMPEIFDGKNLSNTDPGFSQSGPEILHHNEFSRMIEEFCKTHGIEAPLFPNVEDADTQN